MLRRRVKFRQALTPGRHGDLHKAGRRSFGVWQLFGANDLTAVEIEQFSVVWNLVISNAGVAQDRPQFVANVRLADL